MTHDLIVIGAGSAGLTAAGGAAMFGLSVALIEHGEMGGECLNTGCVPSKALIAAARRAHAAGSRLGVTLGAAKIDYPGVRAHIRSSIAAIAPNDSQSRFEDMGVEVLRSTARFLDRKRVAVGNRELSAPRIVIATGALPAIPAISGLDRTPYLTNETIFDLDHLPAHLAILGAGPVGIEMAQAFRRLGSRVTVIARGRPLSGDDPDAAALVVDCLRAEGVDFMLGTTATSVEPIDNSVQLRLDNDQMITATHLLVATGREPNIARLDLAAAGVDKTPKGIQVDAHRRTSNKSIYAIGDCRDGPRFTHAAGYEGSLVALAVALGWSSKVDWSALPHVTYTDPELAQIGLIEADARQRYDEISVTKEEFSHNDRAETEDDTKGFIKVIRRARKVLGVTIVGAGAGDLLLPWAQVITGKTSTFALGSTIIAYPTRSEISKTAAFSIHAPTVFGFWPKRWAALLAKMRQW